MDPYDVLRRPIITEKSDRLADEGQYTFEVDMRANKVQIREAVEIAFDVTVISVNTSIIPGKPRRFGRHRGRTSPWKKAVVTLAEGDHIEIFEGV
ncbi:MAG: 50S ribosomal protein L23 [Anaerolineae bacterium]